MTAVAVLLIGSGVVAVWSAATGHDVRAVWRSVFTGQPLGAPGLRADFSSPERQPGESEAQWRQRVASSFSTPSDPAGQAPTGGFSGSTPTAPGAAPGYSSTPPASGGPGAW